MRLIDADEISYERDWVDGYARYKDFVTKETVEEMPTVNPVKHAHWIFYKDMGKRYIRCSNCGAESGYDDEINWLWGDYCKCCGAKMYEK